MDKETAPPLPPHPCLTRSVALWWRAPPCPGDRQSHKTGTWSPSLGFALDLVCTPWEEKGLMSFILSYHKHTLKRPFSYTHTMSHLNSTDIITIYLIKVLSRIETGLLTGLVPYLLFPLCLHPFWSCRRHVKAMSTCESHYLCQTPELQ